MNFHLTPIKITLKLKTLLIIGIIGAFCFALNPQSGFSKTLAFFEFTTLKEPPGSTFEPQGAFVLTTFRAGLAGSKLQLVPWEMCFYPFGHFVNRSSKPFDNITAVGEYLFKGKPMAPVNYDGMVRALIKASRAREDSVQKDLSQTYKLSVLAHASALTWMAYGAALSVGNAALEAGPAWGLLSLSMGLGSFAVGQYAVSRWQVLSNTQDNTTRKVEAFNRTLMDIPNVKTDFLSLPSKEDHLFLWDTLVSRQASWGPDTDGLRECPAAQELELLL